MLIQISENCWKHTTNGSIFYTMTSDPESELHREDGPAIEYADGSKHWYINGNLHRENGPAAKHTNGYKSWYINGKRHRLDGPAIERVDGTKEWFYHGEYIDVESQGEFEIYIKNLIFY